MLQQPRQQLRRKQLLKLKDEVLDLEDVHFFVKTGCASRDENDREWLAISCRDNVFL